MKTTTREIYRLVPVNEDGLVDHRDIWAAGYDGNNFDSKKAAIAAIPNLRACGPDFDHDWAVVELEEVVTVQLEPFDLVGE